MGVEDGKDVVDGDCDGCDDGKLLGLELGRKEGVDEG